MAGSWHVLTLRSKGQIIILTVGALHSPGVGLHVDMTARFSVFFFSVLLFVQLYSENDMAVLCRRMCYSNAKHV